MTLTGTQGSSRRENRSASSSSEKEATTVEDATGKIVESGILTRTQESSEDSSFAYQKDAKSIVIDGQENIYSVAFLVDGKHVMSGSMEGKIRRWRVENGQEVETPMDAGSPILCIAVSRNGKCVVSGTESGLVTVWNAESHSKVTEWKAHDKWVQAVDISPDGTKIATGSYDQTVCVWSLSTGKRLLGPFKHAHTVVAVKFSPNGRLVATATWDDVRVYKSHGLLIQFPIKAYSGLNQSLAWASDSKQLFALSRDGNVHCLDVSIGKTRSKWRIPSGDSDIARCIALAGNGTFITVSANSSITFWDTATHEQIGSVIEQTHSIWCLAISVKYDLAMSGGNTTTLRGLCDILPSRYLTMYVYLREKTSCEMAF